ncbi:hypothetical protein GCM10007198_03410 [Microbacterium aerolatum]|uniref:Uncharacterized protein n=1 Tax=Microbacterium aerolatum TaxID=153731 RepID=A0A511AHL9_9MICO|nr:hypothetical protein MAE01_13870 [Microbacterium aerolatum]GGB16147.1 hypothetical protein GCM10007198_03410 [Microbacterium aerolatum]
MPGVIAMARMTSVPRVLGVARMRAVTRVLGVAVPSTRHVLIMRMTHGVIMLAHQDLLRSWLVPLGGIRCELVPAFHTAR